MEYEVIRTKEIKNGGSKNEHTQMLKDMVMHLEDPGVNTKVIEREVEIYQGRKIP